MTEQQTLDMPDGLRAPFYSIVWRYGTKIRDEDDCLRIIVSCAVYGSDDGQHYLYEIGDADGPLWRMDNPMRGWQVFDRAPVPDPEDLL